MDIYLRSAKSYTLCESTIESVAVAGRLSQALDVLIEHVLVRALSMVCILKAAVME
jgi:hypothetical protein